MRDEYDFSNAKKNPYAKQLKQQITIDIDIDTEVIEHFKSKSKKLGIPYKTLINIYLKDSIQNEKAI